ncbi:4'-phosphopantetheinyl transferase family protein [Spirulina subsalsa]|uniref:4'-phosphopantetheinyl transferase family protein n=1 Tax=Spirulina subsalsa TaxID=54311 RepID=UPI0002D7CDCC|nr:4'-phosphopantetheinyl transferase superfamily protein [Spirulina subsalsa]
MSLSLPLNEIHLWQVSLLHPPFPLPQLISLLSPDEQARATRYALERDRVSFQISRGCLRLLLAHYLATSPHRLQFSYTPNGKPSLTDFSLSFNLSHSHQLALYSITPRYPIGVDLEHLRPIANVVQLAQRFFTPREAAQIAALEGTLAETAFFQAWTRKEAYLKATGEGIKGLKQVEVSCLPDAPVEILHLAHSSETPADWSLYHLTPAPDYIGALAVGSRDVVLRCWGDWETLR